MKHCSRGEGGGNVDMRNKICELHGKLFEPKRQYVNIQSQNDIQWPFCFVLYIYPKLCITLEF